MSTTAGLRRGARWAALPVAAGYGLVVWGKWTEGLLGELWWMCHVATLLLAVGLASGRRQLVVVGTLIHLAAGWYVYLLDAILGGQTTFSSFVSHIVSPAIGLWATRRTGPLPSWSAPAAWAIMVVTMVAAWAWVDPSLNVNQSQRAWIPGDPREGAALWVTNLVMLAAASWAGAWVFGRWTAKRSFGEGPLGEGHEP